MRRLHLILAVVAMILWSALLTSLCRDASTRSLTTLVGLAAALTLAAHLVGGSGLWPFRPGWSPTPDVGWVEVQGEKHRRKGACFAAWGVVVAGLAWALAWFGLTGKDHGSRWLFWWAAGVNLGFQPSLFVAEFLGIVALSKLSRLVARSEPIASSVGSEL